MLIDEANITVNHPGDGKVYSLAQLNRRLQSCADTVLGEPVGVPGIAY